MAPTIKAIQMTPLAALIDNITRATIDQDLGTYLAIARIPGPDWKSYDDIAADLTAMATTSRLPRPLNRVTIKTFATAIYGLPHDAQSRYVGGKSLPCAVSADVVDAYVSALDADRVDVAEVAKAAASDADAPECSCAMSEATMVRCLVHGYDAPEL